MATINFLKETIETLTDNGKTPEDVLWCGYTAGYFTWEEFKEKADFKYSNGFGGEEIDLDLLVVGKDFWLERHEYDGSEWWEFKSLPVKPATKALPKVLGYEEDES